MTSSIVTGKTIRELKNNSTVAFEYVFSTYAPKIYYLAFKYTHNKFDADDTVQEVFIKVLNHIKEFNEKKANFGTWIYQITMNYLKDQHRKEKVHRDKVITDNASIDDYSQKDYKEIRVQLSEIEEYVGEQPYRILFMKKGLNMTFEEIGLELDFSPSKVKRIYYETIEKVKSFIS